MKQRYRFFFLLLVLLLCGSSTRVAYGQALANDNPCGAVVLVPQGSICTTPTVGTTLGATATPANGYLNSGRGCGVGGVGNPLDVWYQFTRGSSQLAFGATITVTGNAAGQLRLFSATSCTGPFTEIGCSAATAPNTTAPALVTSSSALTVPNALYFVAVSGYGSLGPGGPFTICITDGPGFVPCDPSVIGPPVYTSPAHTGATFSFTLAVNSVGPFVAQLNVNGNPPVQTLTVAAPSFTLNNLVPGTVYTVGVTGTCLTGGTSTGIRQFTVPPPNDEPCTAQALPVNAGTGCTPVSGADRGATTTVPTGYANPGCAGGLAPHDVWYTVTTAVGGPGSTAVVLTVSNDEAARQVRLFAAPSCAGPFTEIACADTTGNQAGARPLQASGLVPNTTYYVSVSEGPVASSAGFFTICASAQPPVLPCPAPDRLEVVTDLVGATSAGLAIVPVPGSAPVTSYTVTYMPTAGAPVVVTVPYRLVQFNNAYLATAVFLTGLVPNTPYVVTAVANCVSGTQSGAVSTSFTTLSANSAPPANDLCPNATVLPLNTTCVATTGVLTNATGTDPTTSYDYFARCDVYQGTVVGPDVWFRVLVPSSGVVQVTTGPVSGSGVGVTGAALFTGSCGHLRQVDCRVGGGSLPPFAQVNGSGLVPGSTAYVRVWQRDRPAGGAFAVCATAAPGCPTATGLTASALTTTSATLSFILPAGNTGYALTYTTGSGVVQTQSVTASPVVLAGLSPQTTYTVTLTSTCTGALPASAQTMFTTLALPACAPPYAVYTGNLTATTAGVGFVLTPGATGYTLTYQAPGIAPQTLTPTASPVALTNLVPGTAYTVCVMSHCANGLNSSATCTTTLRTPLGARTASALANLVELYPNPAARSTTLSVPAALLHGPTAFLLTDALGRVVRRHVLMAAMNATTMARSELDLNDLPPGLYLVRFFTQVGPLTKWLVVE